MTGLLRTEALTGAYTHAPVLREIDLEIAEGEIVALFGANGAGKTTLLRALSGTLPTASGAIWLDDKRVDGLAPWTRVTRGLAHVPEGRHVFGSMSVRDNLAAGALGARKPPPVEQVYEIFPRLHERQQQLAGTLSGGEQQMVAIGRALMSAPRLLVIDEMSAGLAPVMTQRLVEALLEVRRSGVTVLLVEQAPQLVADAIDRAYLLAQGRIVGAGTLAELGGEEKLAELYLGMH